MFYRCKICLTPNTRPRVTFNNSICNACLNWEEKKKIKWNKREKILKKICNKYRSKKNSFDVIVPGGGGKDSSMLYLKGVQTEKLDNQDIVSKIVNLVEKKVSEIEKLQK